MSSQPQKSAFVTGYNQASLDRYTHRSVQTCGQYLLPSLSSLPPTFTFLDIGCGPGSITTDFAQRYPRAKFIGIDPGRLFIDKATALASERGVTSNTEFYLGDLDAAEEILGGRWGAFDVVHCHQLLNHLPDPVGALRKMRGAAKPDGGIVAAREATSKNGDIIYPLLSGIQAWRELGVSISARAGSLSSSSGLIPGFGPKLLESALAAGWRREEIKTGASTWCYSEPAEKKMWVESMMGMVGDTEGEWYRKAKAAGATEEELKLIGEAWREWEEREESWAVFVSAEVVCRNG
jgi:SAM-dependent methyltransferase